MSNILLAIEDDALVSRMYSKALAFEGFKVHLAPNGRQGLEIAHKIKPDIILLDIMMPKMNGLEVLERIKADPALKSIPVIILTNLSGTVDAQNALKLGAKAYLVKSEYKPKDIARKVKGYLPKKADPQASKPPTSQPASKPKQSQ